MKRTVRVLPRATYIGTGNTRTYLHAVELCEVLGQGDTLLVEVFGHRKDADARVRLDAWANTLPGTRPSEVGHRVKLVDPGTGNPVDSVEFSALRPPIVRIDGPFAARLELLVTIDTANSTNTPAPEFDLEVWVTVVVEG